MTPDIDWVGMELEAAERLARESGLSVTSEDITGRKQSHSDSRRVLSARREGDTVRLLYARFLTRVPEEEST